jgi:hypothetical protein
VIHVRTLPSSGDRDVEEPQLLALRLGREVVGELDRVPLAALRLVRRREDEVGVGLAGIRSSASRIVVDAELVDQVDEERRSPPCSSCST